MQISVILHLLLCVTGNCNLYCVAIYNLPLNYLLFFLVLFCFLCYKSINFIASYCVLLLDRTYLILNNSVSTQAICLHALRTIFYMLKCCKLLNYNICFKFLQMKQLSRCLLMFSSRPTKLLAPNQMYVFHLRNKRVN